MPQLEYDPASDRPRIVEKRDQSIPRLPTIGIRVNGEADCEFSVVGDETPELQLR